MDGAANGKGDVAINMEEIVQPNTDSNPTDSTPLLTRQSSEKGKTTPSATVSTPNGGKPTPKLVNQESTTSESDDNDDETDDQVLAFLRKRLKDLEVDYKKQDSTATLTKIYLEKLKSMKPTELEEEIDNESPNLAHVLCAESMTESDQHRQILEDVFEFFHHKKTGRNQEETLLQNVDDENREPLHVAALNANLVVLKVLLKHLEPKDRNRCWNGDTAYGVLLKRTAYEEAFKKDHEKWKSPHSTLLLRHNEPKCLFCIMDGLSEFSMHNEYEAHQNMIECIKLLLEHNVDVNKINFDEKSPIYIAAERGYKHLVTVLLENQKQKVDVETKHQERKSAKRIIMEKKLYTAKSVMPNLKYRYEMQLSDKLFHLLRTKKYKEFAVVLEKADQHELSLVINQDNQSYTLLQYACEHNIEFDVIKALLAKGANPNLRIPQNDKKPLETAFENNNHKLLEIIVTAEGVEVDDYIVHNPLCNLHEKEIKNYQEVFRSCKIILESPNYKGINLPFEDTGRTMLYYVTHNHEISSLLLANGATLTYVDKHGHADFEIAGQLELDTLRKLFDECITKAKDENDHAVFDFSPLLPKPLTPENTKEKTEENSKNSTENSNSKEKDNRKEMDLIQFLSKSPKLQNLLTHPLVSSFLFMKWHLMRWFFFTNVLIFVGFNISLYFYIFHSVTDEVYYWKYILLVFVGLLTLKEVAEICILRTKYFFSENYAGKIQIDISYLDVENVFEISLVILTYVILLIDRVQELVALNDEFVKLIYVITVLLTSMALLLALEQMPYINHKVAMIKKVADNITKTFILFAIFFIPFALSFNVLYKNPEAAANGEEKVSENFFNSIFLSFFKTVVMMTGEYDMKESINFDKYPIASTILFTLFVFFVAIICFNLLIGLAVSDTQAIINDAEILSLTARTTHICYVQSLLSKGKCSIAAKYTPRVTMNYFDSGRIVYEEDESSKGCSGAFYKFLDFLGINFFYFAKLGDTIAQQAKEIIQKRDLEVQKKRRDVEKRRRANSAANVDRTEENDPDKVVK